MSWSEVPNRRFRLVRGSIFGIEMKFGLFHFSLFQRRARWKRQSEYQLFTSGYSCSSRVGVTVHGRADSFELQAEQVVAMYRAASLMEKILTYFLQFLKLIFEVCARVSGVKCGCKDGARHVHGFLSDGQTLG